MLNKAEGLLTSKLTYYLLIIFHQMGRQAVGTYVSPSHTHTLHSPSSTPPTQSLPTNENTGKIKIGIIRITTF